MYIHTIRWGTYEYNSGEKSSPSDPGVGELFETALYLGVGGETNEKYLLFDFA